MSRVDNPMEKPDTRQQLLDAAVLDFANSFLGQTCTAVWGGRTEEGRDCIRVKLKLGAPVAVSWAGFPVVPTTRGVGRE